MHVCTFVYELHDGEIQTCIKVQSIELVKVFVHIIIVRAYVFGSCDMLRTRFQTSCLNGVGSGGEKP